MILIWFNFDTYYFNFHGSNRKLLTVERRWEFEICKLKIVDVKKYFAKLHFFFYIFKRDVTFYRDLYAQTERSNGEFCFILLECMKWVISLLFLRYLYIARSEKLPDFKSCRGIPSFHHEKSLNWTSLSCNKLCCFVTSSCRLFSEFFSKMNHSTSRYYYYFFT